MSVAEESLRMSGLFEAELLVELMLRFWSHPLAADGRFRNDLLERAAEALRLAITGQRLIEDLPAEHMNLVAAIWYAEWSAACELDPNTSKEIAQRHEWLDTVRRSVPSCFCDPKSLGDYR